MVRACSFSQVISSSTGRYHYKPRRPSSLPDWKVALQTRPFALPCCHSNSVRSHCKSAELEGMILMGCFTLGKCSCFYLYPLGRLVWSDYLWHSMLRGRTQNFQCLCGKHSVSHLMALFKNKNQKKPQPVVKGANFCYDRVLCCQKI